MCVCVSQPSGKQLFLSDRAGLEEAILAAAEGEAGDVAVNEDLFLEEYDEEGDGDEEEEEGEEGEEEGS